MSCNTGGESTAGGQHAKRSGFKYFGEIFLLRRSPQVWPVRGNNPQRFNCCLRCCDLFWILPCPAALFPHSPQLSRAHPLCWAELAEMFPAVFTVIKMALTYKLYQVKSCMTQTISEKEVCALKWEFGFYPPGRTAQVEPIHGIILYPVIVL